MDEISQEERIDESVSSQAAIDHLTRALEDGRDWTTALLEAMALWTTPQETYDGRTYNYFISGEAFDWQLLAERLCNTVDCPMSQREREELLFAGCFPPSFDSSKFKDLLGVEKYRGYLNYYYGITVEEALQLAAELEVQKRQASNGVQYQDDYTEEAFARIYRSPKSALLRIFRGENGLPDNEHMSISESREFTYWLFKYRLKNSDKAKIASDTGKGLKQLERMKRARRESNSTVVAH